MTGPALRRIRHRLRYTQVQLANALGVTPNTVARWERDEVGISGPVARLVQLLAPPRSPRRKEK